MLLVILGIIILVICIVLLIYIAVEMFKEGSKIETIKKYVGGVISGITNNSLNFIFSSFIQKQNTAITEHINGFQTINGRWGNICWATRTDLPLYLNPPYYQTYPLTAYENIRYQNDIYDTATIKPDFMYSNANPIIPINANAANANAANAIPNPNLQLVPLQDPYIPDFLIFTTHPNNQDYIYIPNIVHFIENSTNKTFVLDCDNQGDLVVPITIDNLRDEIGIIGTFDKNTDTRFYIDRLDQTKANRQPSLYGLLVQNNNLQLLQQLHGIIKTSLRNNDLPLFNKLLQPVKYFGIHPDDQLVANAMGGKLWTNQDPDNNTTTFTNGFSNDIQYITKSDFNYNNFDNGIRPLFTKMNYYDNVKRLTDINMGGVGANDVPYLFSGPAQNQKQECLDMLYRYAKTIESAMESLWKIIFSTRYNANNTHDMISATDNAPKTRDFNSQYSIGGWRRMHDLVTMSDLITAASKINLILNYMALHTALTTRNTTINFNFNGTNYVFNEMLLYVFFMDLQNLLFGVCNNKNYDALCGSTIYVGTSSLNYNEAINEKITVDRCRAIYNTQPRTATEMYENFHGFEEIKANEILNEIIDELNNIDIQMQKRLQLVQTQGTTRANLVNSILEADAAVYRVGCLMVEYAQIERVINKRNDNGQQTFDAFLTEYAQLKKDLIKYPDQRKPSKHFYDFYLYMESVEDNIIANNFIAIPPYDTVEISYLDKNEKFELTENRQIKPYARIFDLLNRMISAGLINHVFNRVQQQTLTNILNNAQAIVNIAHRQAF